MTWSAASEKLPPNRWLTVSPAGCAISSATAARLAQNGDMPLYNVTAEG